MGNAKKIAIISPYLDILGGGERYIFSIASILSQDNKVSIFWKDNSIIKKAKEKLNIDLSRTNILNKPSKGLGLIKALSGFDEIVYMTDGSLFLSPCRFNILIIQSPVHIPHMNVSNSIKLSRFNTILCYSEYVAGFIKKEIHKNPIILPPPINTEPDLNLQKENIILSVGRFFPWLHSKRQDILVSVFKDMVDQKLIKNWKLVLIGSVDKGAEGYVQKIKDDSNDYPITVITDADYQELTSYYKKAKIYWHGAGFDQDLVKYPQNAEHFGITTVEAMSFGVIPIVFNGGGQKEIVTGASGFLWDTKEQLMKITINLIDNPEKMQKLQQGCIKQSRNYSMVEFEKKLRGLV